MVHLERLIPDTPYSVNIVALYSDGEGNPSPGQGRTREAKFFSTLFPVVRLAGLLPVREGWCVGGVRDLRSFSLCAGQSRPWHGILLGFPTLSFHAKAVTS
jgi:hypothetical protein